MSTEALVEAVARAVHARDWGSMPYEAMSPSMKESYRITARATLAAIEASGTHVVMPTKPQPEMLGAWYRYKSGFHYHDEPAPGDTSDVGAYAAMLAARPKVVA